VAVAAVTQGSSHVVPEGCRCDLPPRAAVSSTDVARFDPEILRWNSILAVRYQLVAGVVARKSTRKMANAPIDFVVRTTDWIHVAFEMDA